MIITAKIYTSISGPVGCDAVYRYVRIPTFRMTMLLHLHIKSHMFNTLGRYVYNTHSNLHRHQTTDVMTCYNNFRFYKTKLTKLAHLS
jgi:hypothetical protein